jgi:acetoin:2,6-dichlorophenolindophenol oxidoreductase subunit beta
VPRITFLEASLQAIREEMRADSRVFVMGEDIQSGVLGNFGLDEFGPERVRNTPISEAGFIGAGVGAALTGMRPVVDIQCSTFLYSGMDQVISQAAKSRYMFGGQSSVPLVIRAAVWYSVALAAHHSDRPWGMFAQVPGLTIIVPATPYDAKGLMKSAIRGQGPVLYFEEVILRKEEGEVPIADYTVPIGLADVKRIGSDLTVVAVGASVHNALAAAQDLDRAGISVEVIDVRTVVPLDRQTILDSVQKTGKLLVVDPAPGMCSVASEISATVAEKGFDWLMAPITRLTAPHVPVPFSPELERLMYPTTEGIVEATQMMVRDPRAAKGRLVAARHRTSHSSG